MLAFQSTQPEWAATAIDGSRNLSTFISIHAARMGCDVTPASTVKQASISIHAARMGCDAHCICCNGICCNNFNPRSPNGLRQFVFDIYIGEKVISIHAARMGCDLCYGIFRDKQMISIHAARMGCDLQHYSPFPKSTYFNPRSPNGLRRRMPSHLRNLV